MKSTHEQDHRNNLRHSAAHLLAAAVMELWPDTKRTIGPTIDDGFYYDFEFSKPMSETDLPKIEKKMHNIVQTWKSFERHEVTAEAAKKENPNNQYKHELIDEFSNEGQTLTIYQSGNFRDLCRGGHCEHPSKELQYFKLMSIAGAYWRGDEKNQMLTRIYGTAFPTKKELDAYLAMLAEAKKRDHKKLGREQKLFMFHETSPGMPYWLPNGTILYNELIEFWRKEHRQRGYHEIISPILNKKDLYITSGHYDHYWDEMFVANPEDDIQYGVKAMNCPNAMIVFGSETRSYKDLPLRLSDTDYLHRYERSGTLNGLLRVRSFRQDDAHIFLPESEIGEEYKRIFEIIERFYSVFDMAYSFRLGTRPEKFLGDVATWNKAETVLKKVLQESKKEFSILEGDGAFYGPKVDILMKDALGREWQMGTVQLDFQQPRRFELEYTDSKGKKQVPVTIHRVIYGSLERFIGILIEHLGAAFPLWLSPVQVRIAAVSDKHNKFSEKLAHELENAGIRVDTDLDSETVGNKIRKAAQEKIPYTLVIGDKEEASNEFAVRLRGEKNIATITKPDFIAAVTKKINDRDNSLILSV